MQSEALVIRPDSPNPINRLPNLRLGQKTLGHESAQTQLERLRHGHSVAKAAVPPIAFTIMGHGLETTVYKVVPPGCVLVATTNAGASVSSRTAIQNNLKLLDENNRDYIMDPLNHKKEIYKLFGPVSIYTEGELYPDFSYSLLSYYKNLTLTDPVNRRKGKYTIFKTSGITRIENKLPVDPLLIERLKNDYTFMNTVFESEVVPQIPRNKSGGFSIYNDNILNYPLYFLNGGEPNLKKIRALDEDELKSIFKNTPTQISPSAYRVIRDIKLEDLFKFSNAIESLSQSSVRDEIHDDLRFYSEIKPRPFSLVMDIQDYIDDFLVDNYLDFTQERIFKEAGPGVYYNFVCRSIPKKNEKVGKFKLKTSNLHRISNVFTHRRVFVHNVLEGAGRKTRRRK